MGARQAKYIVLPCLRYINSDDWVYEAQTGSSQACPDQGPILSQVSSFMHAQPHTGGSAAMQHSSPQGACHLCCTVCLIGVWSMWRQSGKDSCPWQPAWWLLLHVADGGS